MPPLMRGPCPKIDGVGVGEPCQAFEDLLATPIVDDPAVQGKGVRGLGTVVDRFPERTIWPSVVCNFPAGMGTKPALERSPGQTRLTISFPYSVTDAGLGADMLTLPLSPGSLPHTSRVSVIVQASLATYYSSIFLIYVKSMLIPLKDAQTRYGLSFVVTLRSITGARHVESFRPEWTRPRIKFEAVDGFNPLYHDRIVLFTH